MNIPEHLELHDRQIADLQFHQSGSREEARREYAECRQLWRQTQEQIAENAKQIGLLSIRMADVQDRIEEVNEHLGKRIEEVNANLGARIEALVSAIGDLTRLLRPGA